MEGVVYEAESLSNPGQKMIVKAIPKSTAWGGLLFNTERDALKQMDRLVAADYENLVIVQLRDEGPRFRAKDQYWIDYLQLPEILRARLTFPVVASVGSIKYQLNSVLSNGVDGIVYEAKGLTLPGQKLLVKTMFPSKWAKAEFYNERNALYAMDRLVQSDPQKLLLVERKMGGAVPGNNARYWIDFFELPKSIHSKLRFPVRVSIGNSRYQLNGYLTEGAEGIIYEAARFSRPDRPLIVKSMIRSEKAETAFKNERDALTSMHRLVMADPEKLVIVEPKIEGVGLDKLLTKDTPPEVQSNFWNQYFKLPETFYEKWGLIHGDIRPANVIVDKNGKMHLIDFGRTKKAPADQVDLKRLLWKDQSLARYEWEFFNIETKAFWALKNPLDPKASQFVRAYAIALVLRSDPQKAARVQDEFKAIRQAALYRHRKETIIRQLKDNQIMHDF